MCSIMITGSAHCEEENGWRVRMNDVEEIVRNINGKFEEILHKISVLQKKCSKLEEKVNSLEQKINEVPEKDTWDKIDVLASQAVKNNKYEDAIKLVSGFIANNENDSHVIDAYNRLGELYFSTKEYEKASLVYKEIYTKEKSAAALSKMGICRVMLKDTKSAKTILNKLKIDYKNEKQAISKLEAALKKANVRKAKATNNAANRK